MLWTIVSENDVFYSAPQVDNSVRSSNPFDYVKNGYSLQDATLFGGQNNVNFNNDISGYRTSLRVDTADF